MMIYDDLPTKRFPLITVALIVLNSIVYLYQVSLGEKFAEFIYSMGLLPFEITRHIDLFPPGPSLYFPLCLCTAALFIY